MATDQSMIDSWYQDYLKNPPQAQTYTAAQAGVTNWNVGKDQTVQGQLESVLNKDGMLMQRAATQGRKTAAKRGLLNSSLGIQAGEEALYGAAMPIASQDAGTYANAAQFNANAANTASIANAGFTNDASRFNAGATNDAAAQQRAAGVSGYQQQQQIAAADRQQAAQIAEAQRQQSTQIDANTAAQIRDIEAQAAAQGRQLTAQETAQIRELEAAAARQQAGFTQEQTMQAQQFEQQRQMLTAQTDEQLRMLDAQNGTKLADAYRATSQATYDAYIADVQRIQESDMDPDVKAAQVQNLQGLYETRQQYINTIYSFSPGWSSDWSQFAVEFEQPAAATGG